MTTPINVVNIFCTVLRRATFGSINIFPLTKMQIVKHKTLAGKFYCNDKLTKALWCLYLEVNALIMFTGSVNIMRLLQKSFMIQL